ncbi:hypothetical protein D9619_003506 [Psilocybe cf. subviscida]|uniref:HhH-GPD domain-containing protein n=1 Tax=Psilocybe cf. subviscida TaxID=2480587 RepID=A0A8H5AW94_9AGAR|nr:hypothetical protein D9619_003506 [Psilocybe cf. subviscida]
MASRMNKLKRSHSLSPPLAEYSEDKPSLVQPESPQKAKKQKLQSEFAAESPFPAFPQPTPDTAKEVFQLLSKEHPGKGRRQDPPEESNPSVETGDKVPNVISSLIGTILSQNTSNINSSRAKASLDKAFGKNNFSVIVNAPHADVVEAIRSGGLANKKAKTIQNVLRSIKARHGDYSLQHLASSEDGKRMTDDDIMQELVSYDGVGPKTASCVLLFCLERDSFAVDTHIFRLSKLLGWVPQKADRILTQAHLDHRIPNDLKYGLHVLMITHGRACKGCKQTGARAPCILKTYLKERKSENDTEIEAKVESMEAEE